MECAELLSFNIRGLQKIPKHRRSYRAAGTGSWVPPLPGRAHRPDPRTGYLHPPQRPAQNRPQVWMPWRGKRPQGGGCVGRAEQEPHGTEKHKEPPCPAPGPRFASLLSKNVKAQASEDFPTVPGHLLLQACIVSALLGFTPPRPTAPKMDYVWSAVTQPLLWPFSRTRVRRRNSFSFQDKSFQHVLGIIAV